MPATGASPLTAPLDRYQSATAPNGLDLRHASLDLAPEVTDLLLQAPAWAARGLLYLVIVFFAAALVWARFSVIDIVVQARGTVVPEGYVHRIQAEVDGVIQYLGVREGALVRQGETLFHLDRRDLQLRASHLKAELATAEEQLRQELVMRGAASESLERQNMITQRRHELATIERTIIKGTIVAPIDGTITALDVRHAGTVLCAGQQVASIAPSRARLIVDVQVPNALIGFVERGLPATIKLDAFAFQDYGTIAGRVIDIAADVRSDGPQGSLYVPIAPAHDRIAAGGKVRRLRPGLSLTAEIVTGRQTILDLLLTPIRKLRAEMAHVG